MMVPSAHESWLMPTYVGRWRKGTMSVTMTRPRESKPLPPMPWIERPASISLKLFARQQMSVPTVKKDRDRRYMLRRPNTSDSATTNGWKTASVKRYDVPVQNVSTAIPFSARARDYTKGFSDLDQVQWEAYSQEGLLQG